MFNDSSPVRGPFGKILLLHYIFSAEGLSIKIWKDGPKCRGVLLEWGKLTSGIPKSRIIDKEFRIKEARFFMYTPATENLLHIVVNSLNCMDSRLTGHGERVAYGMLLLKTPGFAPEEVSRMLWTVLFHDVGSFRRVEIKDLLEMEQHENFSHARYGYLFLKQFWPYREFIPMVRYHHSGCGEIEASGMDEKNQWVAKRLQVIDFADLFRVSHPGAGRRELLAALETRGARRFDAAAAAEVSALIRGFPTIPEEELPGRAHDALLEQFRGARTSERERKMLLEALVRSVDFRSRSTALHCATVVHISEQLARLCGLGVPETEAVRLGAMLHDLGKIAIPIEILEDPGKLSGENWEIMRSHVSITKELLKGRVDEEVLRIAVRHHETLDGTGYPEGLDGEQLTLPQRIVAVGDIVSALSEERSYKPAFPIEKVFEIVEDLCRKGKLCPKVVELLLAHREEIYLSARQAGREIAEQYRQLTEEYLAG